LKEEMNGFCPNECLYYHLNLQDNQRALVSPKVEEEERASTGKGFPFIPI